MEIQLLDHQMKFMQSNSPITLFLGGRGCAKSWTAGMKLAVLLSEGKSCIALAQTYKATKLVLFKSVMDALTLIGIPYELNIGDLTIKVNGAILYGFSAESGESIRGITNIKCLLIDEACLCTQETFQIALACCRGAGAPEVYLVSTPRGKSWVNKYITDPDATFIHATSHDNTFLDAGFVKLLESQYSDEFYKQEILGEVLTNDAPNQMIKSNLMENAQNTIKDEPNWKIVIGVDPSRFGQDSTVICVRKGKNIIAHESLSMSDSNDIADLVIKYEKKYGKDNISEINFDGTGGFSSGAFDILKKNHDNVYEINFAGKSPDENLKNMRTYLYQQSIKYFQNGGTIGYYPELVIELEAQEYIIDEKGKKALVPKINIKQKLGKSPDNSDAFVLTLLTKGDMFTDGSLIKQLNEGQRRLVFRNISENAKW